MRSFFLCLSFLRKGEKGVNEKVFDTIKAFVVSLEYDSVHDINHIFRVLFNALYIAEDYSVDYDVLISACLLHDIGRSKKYKTENVPHAGSGAEAAREYLLGLGFPSNMADRVSDCIVTHSFRGTRAPVSIEAKVLFDADKIDLTGCVGIARALSFGSEIDEPLYFADDMGIMQAGDIDMQTSFINTYDTIFKNLDERMYTQRGLDIILRRKQSAEMFYVDLLKEIEETQQNQALLSKVLVKQR